MIFKLIAYTSLAFVFNTCSFAQEDLSPNALESTQKVQPWLSRKLNSTLEDTQEVKSILNSYDPVERVYLPDPQKDDQQAGSVFRWLKLINGVLEGQEQGVRKHYYPMLLKDIVTNQTLALVELHVHPRRVSKLEEQKEILDFYKELGVVEGDAYDYVSNSNLLAVRVLMEEKQKNNTDLMAEILTKAVSYVSDLRDKGEVVHAYPNEVQELPRYLMCYTALNEDFQNAYKQAGFSSVQKEVFKEFWHESYFKSLPDEPTVFYYDLKKNGLESGLITR